MLAMASAATALMVVAGTAIAGHIGSDVKSYTGCLSVSGGTLTQIKEGNAPLFACGKNMVEAHFSGGDITAVRTPAGSGLTGGGENGALSLSLDAGHSLPQGCDSFEFPMKNSAGWVCADHENGTGLALTRSLLSTGNSVEYAIASAYRVKNTPDCSSGQFATGFDSDGDIQCTAPPAATLQAFSAPQANFDSGQGIPDDGAFHVMASVTVPAGNYVITAKGRITSAGNVDDFSSTECQIQSGATIYDSMRWGSVTIDDNPSTTLALAGLGQSAGGTIALACAADSGADDVGLEEGRLVVMKVG